MVLYDTPNLAVTHTVHKLNVATPTFMRAPGENPGTFALESAMDELAVALKMDPVELRLKNYAEKQPTTGYAVVEQTFEELLFAWRESVRLGQT